MFCTVLNFEAFPGKFVLANDGNKSEKCFVILVFNERSLN